MDLTTSPETVVVCVCLCGCVNVCVWGDVLLIPFIRKWRSEITPKGYPIHKS